MFNISSQYEMEMKKIKYDFAQCTRQVFSMQLLSCAHPFLFCLFCCVIYEAVRAKQKVKAIAKLSCKFEFYFMMVVQAT